MKKSRFIAFIASAILLLTGCNGVNAFGKANVNIKRLSASVYDTTETAESANRKNAIDIRYANEEGDSGATLKIGEESSTNYILIYKDENNIQLTVQLDNPKGESIDALEIACDDEDAEILVDGEYKSLNVTSNGRVVNWAQEDPYEKTFYLKTISQDDLNTFRINDIKVNGTWQNKGLDNNELSVYKITKDDLDVKFITNTTEYYECEFICGERVSNLNVTASIPDALTWITTSRVRVTENCVLSWSYDFTFDGVIKHWKEDKKIELFNITPSTPELSENGFLVADVELGGLCVQGLSFNGTDFDKNSYNINGYDAKYYIYSYSDSFTPCLETYESFRNILNYDESMDEYYLDMMTSIVIYAGNVELFTFSGEILCNHR